MKLQVTKYLAIELTEPNELIELISDEDKIEFLQSLSCDQIIFKHVADQIVHGSTEDGCHGCIGSVSSSPSTPLQIVQRIVAKSANDIASREINRLERELDVQSKKANEFMTKYYDLYHNRSETL